MKSSENEAGRRLSIKGHLKTSVVLIVLALVPQPAFSSNQDSQRKSNAGSGIIAGIVVNERREPIARAQVQAFSVRTTVPQAQQGQTVPFSMRASGASISGRVVAEPGAGVQSAVGLRVSASPTGEQYVAPKGIAATVASDWSFRMTGLSGSYQFTAGADRPPFVKAIRLTVDGLEIASGTGVELREGSHELVVFVAPREAATANVDKTLSSAALVAQFKNEKVFWRQFTIAKEIVDRKDASVLPSLEAWLSHEDRHQRGNAAFVFGRLGDPRGFQVIADMLADRSDRPEGQGIPTASSDGRYRVERQIAADRYYAAKLLGELRDPRAVPILVTLLMDKEVNSTVPWALGQIGDKRAVGPLLEALDEDNPSTRVRAIYALETLNAKEALPRLTPLLDDPRKSNFGAQVSVAEAAKAPIAKLR